MPTPPRATRRAALVGTIGTALGGTLTSLAMSGCDADDLRPHDASPSITPSASAGTQTPDETLVDEVATATAGVVGVLRQARAFPALRPVLGSLLRAHREHLEVLTTKQSSSASPSPSASPSASPSQPGRAESAVAALALVRTGEQSLQSQLVAAAGRAESGTLAALLASMSASVAQHLAALPAEPA